MWLRYYGDSKEGVKRLLSRNGRYSYEVKALDKETGLFRVRWRDTVPPVPPSDGGTGQQTQ